MMKPKKKILIRIGSLRHGGAEKVLVTFLKNIPQDRYEIDLLLNLYSGKYLSEVPDWINVLFLHKGEMITTNKLRVLPVKLYRVAYQYLLKKIPWLLYKGKLKGKKYDIEFAAIHGMRDEILQSPLKKSKKLVWIHNDLKKTEFHHYSEKEFLKFFGFDRILVISQKIQEDFENLAHTQAEKQKIIRIYNPIDTEEMIRKSAENTPKYFFSPSEKTFVSVGTVFPQKGFDRLLNVHKKLIEEGYFHNILILGDGYAFDHLQKLKKELGIENTFSMIGYVDNPYPYIKKADFFILPSRYEGYPTVLFEALVLKKKIIATDVSGVREMLENGNLGIISENSEWALYQHMKCALTDPHFFSHSDPLLQNYTMPFEMSQSVKAIQKIIDSL